MKKNNLININPLKRSKGFERKNISIPAENKILFNNSYDKIKDLYSKMSNSKNIGKLELFIIEKIKKSYEKFFLNEKLEPDDMVLKQHENLEFNQLSEAKHLRYLKYRYKFNTYPKIKKIDSYPL